ncbi:sigma 54-interacting transcriptional regulator [Desulfotignum phosphitoxidans]|uniref:Acetoacetate metabolism regulatory protein AtoC n=1 Tax=Desulfotignum phosphitoxidans DSM 13687 TaxID=1286635 RepID=S0G0I1_9BACT|nr:sigma 54-interacting transcriptional regulator [Desulfotignum phosphitoxidans]EMS80893.1 acetoacetate metabolism regulatory protein AtoC [Desulfotignum phosphitoxidans DSM 13687]
MKGNTSNSLINADEGLVVLDRSLGIMSFNPAAREIITPELRYGQKLNFSSFIAGPDLSIIKDAVDATLHQGRTRVDAIAALKTASGKSIFIRYAVHPLYETSRMIIGLIFSFKQVSTPLESHNTTDDISNKALIKHQSLLEALPEGVFTINTKWRIASFNKTAEEITGYSRKEVLGRYCWEVFRSDLCDIGCPLRTAIETGQSEMDQDIRILKKEGARLTILVNIGVLKDEHGRVAGAVETFRPLTGERNQPEGTKHPHAFSHIIGNSRPIQQLFALMPDLAASEVNVFITGESGTGKELFARTLHDNSSRAKHPFVAVNCSALAESVLESELFGHEKGAFTGATRARPGRFERVKKGTLFLDEIGELKPSLQIKLLRVLEQREFERVGGTETLPLEARIISATNRNLTRALKDGSFREDFYYRLRTVPLAIPPLRERKEDIPLLVRYYIRFFNTTFKKTVKGVDPKVMALFSDYDWPGNVRELERTIEHAFVFVKGPIIRLENLPRLEMAGKLTAAETPHNAKQGRNTETILKALEKSDGNRQKAADLLGISRTSLWRKMKTLGLLD